MNLKNIWGTNWQNSGKIDSFTIILGDLNVPLSVMLEKPERLMTVKLYYNPSRPTRLIQRTSSNNSPLFKGTHNTVPDRPHKQPQNKSQKFQTTEIIQSISQWNGMEWNGEWNGMKLGISNWRKMENFSNMWKLNNTILHNKWIKE